MTYLNNMKKVATKKTLPYGTRKVNSIAGYHRNFSGAVRSKLDEIHDIIRKACPKAEEVISYNMPAFKQGKVLVYYGAGKAHVGFYPTAGPIRELAGELTAYKTSKGAIQFPLDKPLPAALIRKIVKMRIAETSA
jgi:uncharacterized protein YdhG (YjbR/CyaY superfamily)